MRHLSKFEFLNLLGIWLFQHVFVYERKDIPFYQFPAKADPSVRLFCFPSAQSRDSDRNNNYPSPPPSISFTKFPFFLSATFFLPVEVERDMFSLPLRPTCRRPELPILGFVATVVSSFQPLPILFEFSFSRHPSLSSREEKEGRKRKRWKWKAWIIAQAYSTE